MNLGYSILFSIDDVTIEEERISSLKRSGASWVGGVNGMRIYNNQIPYMAIAPSLMVIKGIKTYLEAIDSPKIIGIWKSNGLQQGYKKVTILNDEGGITSQSIIRDTEAIFNSDTQVETTQEKEIISIFDHDLYLEFMEDIIINDEDGNEISKHRPSILNQVSNWGGWENKDLTNYNI